MKSVELKITSNTQNIPDKDYYSVLDGTTNGLEIHPEDDSFAIPWDAVISIEGSDVVLEGSAAPGGFGVATLRVDISQYSRIFKVFVSIEDDEAEAILEEYGWL